MTGRRAPDAARRPDLVYGGFVIDSGGVQIIQQMKALGLFPKIKFMGPDGINCSEFMKQAGPAGEGVYSTFGGVPAEKYTGKAAEWLKNYDAKFSNKNPNPYAIYGYEAMRLALDAIERSGPRPLWVVAAVVGIGMFCVSLLRHWALDSHGYDLGIFTNVMWNLVHGNGYLSSVKNGINLFADHQSPTYWLLAPLFWLVPRPETLLFVQALGLAAGGPALYYLARRRFGAGHWAPAALPWLYWAYLPTRNANAFDFHPEVFMLPLFLWAFVGFASERRWAKARGTTGSFACSAGVSPSTNSTTVSGTPTSTLP